MKTYRTYIFALLLSNIINAQLGINTTNPKAALEIKSSNSGLLVPRVSTSDVNNTTPGLIIFNTDAGNYSIKQVDQSWKSPKFGNEPTRFKKALKLNGADFLSMPSSNTSNNNILNTYQKAWSVSFIVKPYSEGANNKLGLLDLRGSQGISIWIENQNLYLSYGNHQNANEKYTLETKDSNIEYDKWNYITITYNGANLSNNTYNPFKVYLGSPTNFNFERENTKRASGNNVYNIGGGSRYINIGRSATGTSADSYFIGEIAAVNLVNRELSDSTDLKLFSLSPKGWMHKNHFDTDNELVATNSSNYDFRIYIGNNSDEQTNIQLTAESNKIWLFGNGEFDGIIENSNYTIRNQITPNPSTPITTDIGKLNLKGSLTLSNIIDINDLNINL